MPLLNSSMVITIYTPFAILALAVVGGLAAFALQRNFRKTKTLMRRMEEQNAEIDALKTQKFSETSRQAYLEFMYNISHDVSNPLQSIQINLENMVDCSPEEIGRWKQYYEIINQEIKRLSMLTENLRLLSHLEHKGEAIEREPVNLKSVVEDVIMFQAERASKKNVRLKYQGPSRPAKVFGNQDYLYRLIINLIDNSVKYSKDSGGKIIIKLAERDNFLQITISDDGIGIPQEDLPFVFETAYRSKNKESISRPGSGLGLAIVKHIVNQHEGQVRIDSVLGEGTTVTIDLPVYNPAGQE